MSTYQRTYDPKQVIVTIKDTVTKKSHVITGFAEGTMVAVDKNVENVTQVIGGQGDTTDVLNHDETGAVTTTLKVTSPILPDIRRWANSHTPLEIQVNDKNEHSKMVAGGPCRIAKPPAESRGSSIENVPVLFKVSKYGVK